MQQVVSISPKNDPLSRVQTAKDRTLELDELLTDVLQQLPEEQGNIVSALTAEFNVGEDLHFVLGLVSGFTKRQRKIVRLLLNDLEKLENAKEAARGR
jgi:hypothetical protein